MKSIVLAAAFLGALSSASANTILNLDISATDQQGHTMGTAKCRIDQTLDTERLPGSWTCSFNKGANQILNTHAVYLSEANGSEPSHLGYSLDSGDSLGDLLYKGLNLTGAKDYNLLVINLGSTPSTESPFLMVGADDYSHYYYLNFSVQSAN